MMPPAPEPDRVDPDLTVERVDAVMWRSREMIMSSLAAIGRTRRTVANCTQSLALARHSLQAAWRSIASHQGDLSPSVSVDTEIAVRDRLHDMTVRYLRDRSIGRLLDDALDAVMVITEAPLGNVQLADDQRGVLRIVTQRGFRKDFLDFFAEVCMDASACAEARKNRRRVIVSDVSTDPIFSSESRRVILSAGVRAVQSTPLVSSKGRVLGVVSTHFYSACVPSARVLRIVDLYAHQLAALIEAHLDPSVGRTPGAGTPG